MAYQICCVDGVCTLPDAQWHGKYGGVNNHHCKCRPCRDAHAEYYRIGPGAAAIKRYRVKLAEKGLTLDRRLPRTKPYKPRTR
jgi:hypothetical protein